MAKMYASPKNLIAQIAQLRNIVLKLYRKEEVRMSYTIKCPFCDTVVDSAIEVCPNCQSWFVEPHLPNFKFTEFRTFIALSIVSLGFLNLFGFLSTKKLSKI